VTLTAVFASALPAALGLALLFWADRLWLEWDEAEQRAMWPAMAVLRIACGLLLLFGVVWFTIGAFLQMQG